MADQAASLQLLIQLLGPERVAALQQQQQSFGGGAFGGAGFGGLAQPTAPISLKALQPFLALNTPNLDVERARVQAAELRKRAGTMIDHSAHYGERGGGALAIGDAIANAAIGQRNKTSESNLADQETNLGKARESAGGASLALQAADQKQQDDDANYSVAPASKVEEMGTPLTQAPPETNESAGLRTDLTPQQLLKAYQLLKSQGDPTAGIQNPADLAQQVTSQYGGNGG